MRFRSDSRRPAQLPRWLLYAVPIQVFERITFAQLLSISRSYGNIDCPCRGNGSHAGFAQPTTYRSVADLT